MTQDVSKETSDLTVNEIEGLSRGVSDFTATHQTPDSYRSYNFSSLPFLGVVLPLEIEKLMEVVNKLPTADTVAEYFREKGIKGTRKILEDCPIANWAKSCGAKGVQVDNRGLQVDSGGQYGMLNLTSNAFQEFVVNFDAGKYPFLEA